MAPGTDYPDWIAEITAWWVNLGGTTHGGRTVHLPASVDPASEGDPTDPDCEPRSEPVCGTTRHRDTGYWRVKPLAVLPLGWRPLCVSCRWVATHLHEHGEVGPRGGHQSHEGDNPTVGFEFDPTPDSDSDD